MKPGLKLNRGKALDGGLLLTPLLDIMFLVTIFFVLTSSYSQKPAIEIALPEADTGKPALIQEVNVYLKNDGRIFVNIQEVTLDSLAGVLQEEARGKKPETVLLHGDKSIPYGLLINVMDRIRALGWDNISLVTENTGGNG